MPVKSPKSRLIGLLLLILLAASGCAGKPLAEREIVRAVFWASAQNGCQAVLVLQNLSENSSKKYTVSSATALSPAQALRKAEQGLKGEPFYGSMDLLVLPTRADWSQCTRMAAATLNAAEPNAEMETILLNTSKEKNMEKSAPDLYDEIKAMEKKYSLHAGVETLFAQETGFILPQYQTGDYRTAIVENGSETILFGDAFKAQLALLLAGKTDQIDCDFAQGQAHLTANASVMFEPKRDREAAKTVVHVALRNPALTYYGSENADDKVELQRLFVEHGQQTFDELLQDTEKLQTDVFHFSFWAMACDAAHADGFQPCIEFQFEP